MATPHGLNEYQFDNGATSSPEGQLGGVAELSRSNEASIKASFPGGSVVWDRTRDEITADQQTRLLDGIATNGQSTGQPVVNGFCMSSDFNRDYSANSPPTYDFMQGQAGAGGAPGSAFTPNTASPVDGSTEPIDMPAPPAWMDDPKANKTTRPPFNGRMTDVDPATTSTRIAGTKKETLGSLMGISNGRVEISWGSSSAAASQMNDVKNNVPG